VLRKARNAAVKVLVRLFDPDMVDGSLRKAVPKWALGSSVTVPKKSTIVVPLCGAATV